MVYKTLFLLVLIKISSSIKVNLQGQITLGTDVMDTLSYILERSAINGRRALPQNQEKDVIAAMITSKELCVDLKFCSGPLKTLVDDYLILLVNAVGSIYETSFVNESFPHVYYDKVDKILREVKRILKNVDSRITDDKAFYYWSSVMKRISARFHHLVTNMNTDRFEIILRNNSTERKLLVQKLITAIAVVEHKYENELCKDHKICIQSYECTQALYDILNKLTNMPDDKIRYFMKNFYEALLGSSFYSQLDVVTAMEFQNILNNMAISSNVPTQSMLESVERIVEMRLQLIKNYTDNRLGYDVLLVHMILSDLDFMYSTHKQPPLREFITRFELWTFSGHLGRHLRDVINEIGYELSSQPGELFEKVTNEVRVFLEITVDPEN